MIEELILILSLMLIISLDMDPFQPPHYPNTGSDLISATTFYPSDPFPCNSYTSRYKNDQCQPSQLYSPSQSQIPFSFPHEENSMESQSLSASSLTSSTSSYSPPLINVSTTNTSSSISHAPLPCSICGDRAGQHLHYGAVACFSCRQFFRRGKTRGKQCIHGTGGCVINKHNRTNCKPCRLG